jgi:hypothetical protein
MYDPLIDVWTKKANMPHGVGETFVVVDNKVAAIYSISLSGHSNDPLVNFVMIYDPETDIWSEKTHSDAYFGHSSAAGVTTGLYVSQKIYLIGTKTTVYDLITDNWPTAKDMLLHEAILV